MPILKSFLIAILIITNLTSCTKKLWEKTQYEENLKNLYITKDGKKIVIVGKKYHYVFDDESGELIKLLSWKSKSKLEIENYDFQINEINKITGSIALKTKTLKEHNSNLNKNEKSFLQKLGFVNSGSKEVIFKKKIDIFGNRYSPKSIENFDVATSLNHEHKLNIEVADYADKTKKIILTPVAIVGDGLIISLYVLLNFRSMYN